jgi:hypothetical protein
MTRRNPLTTLAFLLLLAVANPVAAEDRTKLIEHLAALPADLAKCKPDDAKLVDALFLDVLKREPAPNVRATMVKHLANAKVRENGCRDLLWALVNSNEFMQLHGLTVMEALEFGQKLGEKWEKK